MTQKLPQLLLSQLVDKPLITMIDATIAGKIIGMSFDSKFIYPKNLIIKSHDQTLTTPKYIQPKYIWLVSEDCILTKHSSLVTNHWNTLCTTNTCPIGTPVYNQDGLFLGNLSDIKFHSRSYKIVVGKRSFDRQCILSISSQVVLVCDNNKKITLRQPRTTIPKANMDNLPVHLHGVNQVFGDGSVDGVNLVDIEN